MATDQPDRLTAVGGHGDSALQDAAVSGLSNVCTPAACGGGFFGTCVPSASGLVLKGVLTTPSGDRLDGVSLSPG